MSAVKTEVLRARKLGCRGWDLQLKLAKIRQTVLTIRNLRDGHFQGRVLAGVSWE